MLGKILIIGKDGQLGSALRERLGENGLALSQSDINFSEPDFVLKLPQEPFDAVINAAAYTAVDKAEGERKEAMRINAEAVAELAAWCKTKQFPLVHFSTDYVFDGSGNAPHHETDETKPLNIYGESKLAGEKAIEKSGAKYLIFRTSWLYDAYGKNFFNTMLKLMKEKDKLRVINDQFGAPTYASQLAEATVAALDNAFSMAKFPSGLYHLCNQGETSWYGFAQAIFELAKARDSGITCRRIDAIESKDYSLPAKRPLNSRLDCSKAKEILGVSLPDWQEGLKECVKEKYGRAGLQTRWA